MIESFTTALVAVHEEDEFVVIGFGRQSSDGYLMLQRTLPIGCEDDYGVYVEYEEEAQSVHDGVSICGVSRHRLLLELAEGIGPGRMITGFDLELAINDQLYLDLTEALHKIFSDTEGILHIDYC
jgi:hypothetical protein